MEDAQSGINGKCSRSCDTDAVHDSHSGRRFTCARGLPLSPRASGRLVAIVFFQTPCVQWNVPQAEFGVGTGACCAGPCDVGCHLIRWE